jgi:uncharacterized protein (TIGR02118 family)
MVKIIAMFKTPGDKEMFDKHYYEKHMPLVAAIPGLIKSEVSKIKALPGTESDYYLMTEMYYENMDAFNAAMATPEGKASARDIVNFAKDNVEFFIGKVE